MAIHIGFVDDVHNRIVRGWAFNRKNPERIPVVRLQVNGQAAGFAPANLPRPDLKASGHTDLPRGFEHYIPDEFGAIRSIRVVVSNEELELPESRNLSLEALSNRPIPDQWKPAGRRHRYPSFFILGAAKCGTTSLHGYLRQHPDICMSQPKEPFFFEAEWEQGSELYFRRYFSHWKGESVVGEARHRNFYLPFVPERLVQFNPQARLIVCLRNPVERAISHWWHWFTRGEEVLSFRDSIFSDWNRIQAGLRYDTTSIAKVYADTLRQDSVGMFRTYIDSGYYHEQIARYLALFPRQQMKVIFFEDMVRNPQRTIQELCEFLDADPAYARTADYTALNRSLPGALEQVDAATVDWLREHYEPHNEKLTRLLANNAPWLSAGLSSMSLVG